jgi:hypothetical protein
MIAMAKRRIVFLISILITAVIIVSISLNDLRRPVEHIQNKLLAQMPIGSAEEEVVGFILQNENWKLDDWVSYAEPGSDSYGGHLARTRRVHMDTYRGIFFLRVDVIAYWRFDEDAKLFQLIVRKYHDVL